MTPRWAVIGLGVVVAAGVVSADGRRDAIKDLGAARAGSWACTGTSGTNKVTGSLHGQLELEHQWLHETLEVKSGKASTMRVEIYTTYDPTTKKYRRIQLDSNGDSAHGDGTFNGTTLQLELQADGAAGAIRVREDWSSPKTGITYTGEASTDGGKTWKKGYDLTCTKSDAFAQMQGFTDRMCACKDRPCTDKVNDDMTKAMTEIAKSQREQRPTEDEVKRATDMMKRYTECQAKAMGGTP